MDDREGFDVVEPNAPAMIESLRAVGYDLSSAIADLVDNSLAVGSTEIGFHFFWNGELSNIALIDNGTGMSEDALREAMRLGTDPPAIRSRDDLGRFGFGLKTASFSQCRKVTVCSKTENTPLATRCWDLDYVRETQKWRILRSGSSRTIELSKRLGQSGTVVVWENLDRLVAGTAVESVKDRDNFNARIETVQRHLAMTFHRFLERTGGVTFKINDGAPIKPWDPFLASNPATQHPEPDVFESRGETVVVDSYVLPHHSKLTPQEFAEAAGPNGWLAQQGFYVYRNRRLLVAGDWLGIGIKKEEHYKLARIKIDIPNTLDDLWELDIKKCTARVPVSLRRQIAGIGKITREKAVEVYRHRGSPIGRERSHDAFFVWQQKVKHGKLFYRINRQHPLIAKLLSQDGDHNTLVAALRLIEESIPVPLIILSKSQTPETESLPFEHAEATEVYELAVELYKALVDTGVRHDEAVERLYRMEPFNRLREFVANLPEVLKKKGLQ